MAKKQTEMQKKMAHIRSFKGKKGHTHRKKSKDCTGKGKNMRLKHPIVQIELPRNAILKVKRKPHNPYMIKATDDATGQVTSEKIWYSPDYKNPQ